MCFYMVPTWMPVWTAMTVITDDSLLHSVERSDREMGEKEILKGAYQDAHGI